MVDIKAARKTLAQLFNTIGGISEEVQEKLYKKLEQFDRPIISTLCTYLEHHTTNIERFYNLFNQSGASLCNKYKAAKKPVIMLHPTDPTMLRVYPNLVLSVGEITHIKSVSIFDADSVFKDFLTAYDEDIKHPSRKAMWETTERIEKRLNEYVDMTTARVLTRYVEWGETIPDNIIRDTATAIDGFRKPIEIKFADTPQDWSIMYGSGPSSCMSVGHGSKWRHLEAVGMCPPSWYAYFPYTKGAYAIKGKQVVARAVLFKYPDKDTWYYGRVYSSNTEYHTKFIESLVQQGITNLEKSASYTPHKLYSPPVGTTFEIPGVSMGDTKYCMPWPYFDNMEYYGKGFHASFNLTTKVFTISYNGKEGTNMLPVNNVNGMLISTDYISQICSVCHKTIPKTARIASHDGTLFCSATCANSKGFYKMINVDGNETYQQINEHVVKSTCKDKLFTTLAAAQANGQYPLVGEDHILPEEGDIIVTDAFNYTWFDADDKRYVSMHPFKHDRIPIDIKPGIKVVEWVEKESLYATAKPVAAYDEIPF